MAAVTISCLKSDGTPLAANVIGVVELTSDVSLISLYVREGGESSGENISHACLSQALDRGFKGREGILQ